MSTTAYRYRYNGKEQLSRFSGRYDYGFRMYDAGVGKFLSVDPLTRKYPELSPYAAVANSPIAYKEIDGRDFELVINHDTREIIVKATYYVLESDKDTKAKLEKAVGVWNSQNKFKYTFENDNQNISYAIKFDLNVQTVGNLKDVPLSFTDDNGRTSNNIILNDPSSIKAHNKSKYGYQENKDMKIESFAFTTDGNKIYTYEETNVNHFKHEIGHTLGAPHLGGGKLMDYNSGTGEIDANVVGSILPFTMPNITNRLDNIRPGKSKNTQYGISPKNFNNGKIE